MFDRGGVQEWYANGPLGLEQGFTLPRRPSGGGGGPLTLALGLPAGTRARVADGELVLGRSGRARVRYSGLVAVDARGRSLRAWLHTRMGLLLVRVDDRGARYPVRVDPFVQAAKLTAKFGAVGDQLGFSSAVSRDGQTVVAGTGGANGGVYVFTRPPNGWGDATETRILSGGGSSVAVSGDGSTVVAGAADATIGSNAQQGEALVFVRQSGSWTNLPTDTGLLASDGGASDNFGSSVAVSADGLTVVVGAPGATVGGHQAQGAAYVFEKGAGWNSGATNQTAKLLAQGGGSGTDHLGSSVAVSNDGSTAVAGGPGLNNSTGIVYVFVRGTGWSGPTTQGADLMASDGKASDDLGRSVALSNDGSTVVAGATGTKIGMNAGQGAAYVFVRPSGGWVSNPVVITDETAKLTASDGAPDDAFGESVAVSDDGSAALAGALATIGSNSRQGAVYAFERPASGPWATTSTPAAKLTAPDGSSGDGLGWSVALSGDGSTAVGGALGATVGGHVAQGAVYVFPAATSASVACQPSPVVVGHSSACTATVAVKGPGNVTPTDSVTFTTSGSGSFSGGGSCVAAPSATPGLASCELSYTPSAVGSGSQTITASYGGDANHAPSQGATPLAVSAESTSTAVSCQTPAVVVGRPDACTATITDTGGSGLTPSGPVSFTTGSSGSLSGGGSCTLSATSSAGVASCRVSYTPSAVGSTTHTITAGYGGDPNHTGSAGAGQVGVSAASTSTVVACQPLSVSVGGTSVCAATVTDTTSGSVTPQGRVRFTSASSGAFSSGDSCTLAPAAGAGVASCQVPYVPSAIGSGTHTITASYPGDSGHLASRGSTLIAVKASHLPKVRINGRQLVAHRGVVTASLSCPAGEKFCDGTLSVYAQASTRANAGTVKQRLLLARAHFHIPGGRTRRVKLHLRKPALNQLGGTRAVRVTVTVIAIARDQAGRSATTTAKDVTLLLRA